MLKPLHVLRTNRAKVALSLMLALPLSVAAVACSEGTSPAITAPLVENLAQVTNTYVNSLAAVQPNESSRFDAMVGPDTPAAPALVTENYYPAEYSTNNYADERAAQQAPIDEQGTPNLPPRISALSASEILADEASAGALSARALGLRLRPRDNNANPLIIVRNLTSNIASVKVDVQKLPVLASALSFVSWSTQTMRLSGTINEWQLTREGFGYRSYRSVYRDVFSISHNDASGNIQTQNITGVRAFHAYLRANALLIDQAALNSIKLTIESANPEVFILTPFVANLDISGLSLR